MANNSNKENDWFIASVISPDKTLGDFSQEGLTVDNTQLLNKDVYKKDEKIKDLFQTSDGKFDESGFDEFYGMTVSNFNRFAEGDFSKTVLTDDYISADNIYVTDPNVKRLRTSFSINKVKNPTEDVQGILGFTHKSEGALSQREIGQKQKAFNTKTGKWEEAPNERGFWNTLFTKETYVMATYDEDTMEYDKDLGREVLRRKGEFKLNDRGKTYYETLGDREVYGKVVLSPWDVLTVDGSYMNKFDFMDSDSKDKSLTGTIVKNVATVAPYFIPFIGQAYTGLAVGKMLTTDIMPALVKMTGGIMANDDFENSELFKMANRLEAKGRSFSSGVSDHSQQNAWTGENIINMVGDIMGQLAEQKFVGSLPQKIGYNRKQAEVLSHLKRTDPSFNAENAKKILDSTKDVRERTAALASMFKNDQVAGNIARNWDMWSGTAGRNISSLYMAGMASTGAMEAARLHGLDMRDTGFLFLGTMAGMHQLMKSDVGSWVLGDTSMEEVGEYLKQVILKRVKDTKPIAEQTLKTLAKSGGSKVGKEVVEAGADEAAKEAKKNVLSRLFNAGKGAAESVGAILSSGGGMTTMKASLSEMIEETSEEFIQDGIEQVYNIFNTLGWTSTAKDKVESFEFEDFFTRYGMAAFGGAIGGAIFHKMNGPIHSVLPEGIKHEVIDALMHNHGDQLLAKLDNMHKRGLLGSTALTALREDTSAINLSAESNYKPHNPSDPNSMSQNDLIYEMIKSHINFTRDSIFQEEGFSVSRLTDLYNYRHSELLKFKYTTPLDNDLQRLASEIVDVKAKIKENEGVFDEATRKSKEENDELNAENYKKLDELREELDDIVSGRRYGDYLKQALFTVQPELYTKFFVKDKDSFAQSNYGKKFNDLNANQKEDIEAQYDEYIKFSKAKSIEIAVSEFDEYLEKFDSNLAEVNQFALDRDVVKRNIDAFTKHLEDTFAVSESPENIMGYSGNVAALYFSNSIPIDSTEVNRQAREQIISLLDTDPYADEPFYKSVRGYLRSQRASSAINEVVEIEGMTRMVPSSISSLSGIYSSKIGDLIDGVVNIKGDDIYINDIISTESAFGTDLAIKVLSDVGINLGTLEDINSSNIYDNIGLKRKIESKSKEISEALDREIRVRMQNDSYFENSDTQEYLSREEFEQNENFQEIEDKIVDLLKNTITDYLGLVVESLSGNMLLRNMDGSFTTQNLSEASLNEDLNEEDKEVLQDRVDTIDFAEKFFNIMESGKKTNPLFKLAKDIIGEPGGRVSNFLDVLASEYGNLSETNRVEEYMINNPLDTSDLELLINGLKKAQAVIFGATDFSSGLGGTQIHGYNSAVNAAVGKGISIDGNQPRTVIDSETGIMMNNEIESIIQKTNLLLSINKFNLVGSIRESRRTSSRFMTLMLESLTNKEGPNYKALQSAGVDMSKLDVATTELETFRDVFDVIRKEREGDNTESISSDEETMSSLRKELNTIEQVIYEITNIDNDPSVVIPAVIEGMAQEEIIDLDDFSNFITNLNPLQQKMILAKSISVDPKQFYKDYVGDVEVGENRLTDSPFAPFYGQELAVSYGYWAMMSSKKDIDTYKLFTDRVLPNNKLDKSEYVPGFNGTEFKASLNNAIVVFGIPGAGKSTAVIDSLFKIAKSYNLEVAGYAPHDTQLKNLDKLEILNKERTTRSLFNNVFGIEVTEEIFNTHSNFSTELANSGDSIIDRKLENPDGETSRYSYNINTKHPKVIELLDNISSVTIDGKVPNVVIVDEITQVPSPAVQLLDLVIDAHNKKNPNNKIIAIHTGDIEQNGNITRIKLSNNSHSTEQSSIATYNYVSTPVLSQSLRSNYNLLNNNINKVRALNRIINDHKNEGSEDFSGLKHLMESPITFDYKVEDNRMIGYKITPKVEISTMVEAFDYKGDGVEVPSVAIIVDSSVYPSKVDLKESLIAEGVDENRIQIFRPDEVQGLEFDYVVIDVPNVKLTSTDYANDVIYPKLEINLKNIYTLASRSKIGTIMNEGLTNSFNITSSSEHATPQQVSLDQGEITAYKDFTIESINGSIKNLKDFDSNITTAFKTVNTSEPEAPMGSLTKEEKEIVTDSVYKGALGKLSEKEGADGKEVKIRTDETRPIIYSYHVRSGYITEDNDVVVETVSNGDVDEKAQLFNDVSYKSDIPMVYQAMFDESIDEGSDSTTENLIKAKRVHFEVKDSIVQYLSVNRNGKNTLDGLAGFIESKFNTFSPDTQDFLNNHILDNIEDYRLAVMTKTFDKDFDRDTSNLTGTTSAKTDNRLISYLVLVEPNSNANAVEGVEGDPYNFDKVITLMALANPDNTQAKKIKGVVETYKTLAESHAQFIEDTDDLESGRSFFFSKTNDLPEMTPISNIGINTPKDAEYKDFSEFKKDHSGFYFTEPFFLTENIIEKFIDEASDGEIIRAMDEPLSSENKIPYDLTGSNAVFVTKDPSIKSIDDALNRMRDEIALARTSPDGYPGTVRILPLNNKGRKFSEFITHANSLIKKYSENPSSKGIADLRNATNDYASAKIIARLTNVLFSAKRDTNAFIPKYLRDLEETVPGFKVDNFLIQLEAALDHMYRITTGKPLTDFYASLNSGLKPDGNTTDEYRFYENSKKSSLRSVFPLYSEYYAKKLNVDPTNLTGKQAGLYNALISNSALEYVMAQDILKVSKDENLVIEVLASLQPDDVSLAGASEYVIEQNGDNAKNTLRGLKGISTVLRSVISGGKFRINGQEGTFRTGNINSTGFMDAMDAIITGSESNSFPLFPDGVWVDLFRASGTSHAAGDKVSYYKIATGDEHLRTKVKLSNPNFIFDISQFNTPEITSVNTRKEKIAELNEIVSNSPNDVFTPIVNEILDKEPLLRSLLYNKGGERNFANIIKKYILRNADEVINHEDGYGGGMANILRDSDHEVRITEEVNKAIDSFWESNPGHYVRLNDENILEIVSEDGEFVFDLSKLEIEDLDLSVLNSNFVLTSGEITLNNTDGDVEYILTIGNNNVEIARTTDEPIETTELDVFKRNVGQYITSVGDSANSLGIYLDTTEIIEHIERLNNEEDIKDFTLDFLTEETPSLVYKLLQELGEVYMYKPSGSLSIDDLINNGASQGIYTTTITVSDNNSDIGELVLDLSVKGELNIMRRTMNGVEKVNYEKTLRQQELDRQQNEEDIKILEQEKEVIDNAIKQVEGQLKDVSEKGDVEAGTQLTLDLQAGEEIIKGIDNEISDKEKTNKEIEKLRKDRAEANSPEQIQKITNEAKEKREESIKTAVNEVKQRKTKKDKIMDNLRKLDNDKVNQFVDVMENSIELAETRDGQAVLSKAYLYAKYELNKDSKNSKLSDSMTEVYNQIKNNNC